MRRLVCGLFLCMLACQCPLQAAGEQVPSCIYENTSQDGLVVQMGLMVNLEKGHCDFSDQDEWVYGKFENVSLRSSLGRLQDLLLVGNNNLYDSN